MRRSRTGLILMMVGGGMLLADLLMWAIWYILAALRMGGGVVEVIASLDTMLLFLFGLPLIFIGVAVFLIGLARALMPGLSRDMMLIVSGLIIVVVGVLAFIIPQLLVEPGSGDTLMAWMAGLTALFVGIPMPFFGAIVLLVGLILIVRRHIPSLRRRAI